MVISITPGLDFAVDDVPTNRLLTRQAQDLRITGIPASQIEGTIIAIVFGDSTGASGAVPPDLGWIWVDQAGHRNIGDPRLDARVWNAHGGWETGRFDARPNAGGGSLQEGIGMGLLATGAQFEDVRLDMDLENYFTFAAGHARDSNFTSSRLHFRGGANMLVGNQATRSLFSDFGPATRTTATGQGSWVVFNTRDAEYASFTGYLYSEGPGSTGDSFVAGQAFGWMPGVLQRGAADLT